MNVVRFLSMAAALLGGVVHAQTESLPFGFGAGSQQAPSMSVSMGASVSSYKPGETFYVALRADIPSPWHAYFRNPATVGEPMEAALTAPEGFTVEGPFWQAPDRHEGMLGVAYTYNTPTIVWKVTPGENAPQQAEFTASATAQTCCDSGCNAPETHSATLSLHSGDGAAAADWTADESKVEILGDTPTTITADQSPDSVVLSFTADGEIKSAYFFSDDNSISPTAQQVLTKTDQGYSLTLTRNDNSDSMAPVKDETLVGKPLLALRGILTFDGRHSTVNISFDNVAPAVSPAPAADIPEVDTEEDAADEDEADEESSEDDEEEEGDGEEEETDESADDSDATPLPSDSPFGGIFNTPGNEPDTSMTVRAKASVSSYKVGTAFYVALKAEIPEPWHAYYRNPATIGEPMTANLTAPTGFSVEGPYWQAPERHESMLGVAYTYNTPTIVWKLTPQENAPQQADITMSTTAQTCSDTGCNPPETRSVTISLHAGDGAGAADWEAEESKVEVLGDTPTNVTMTQSPGSVVLNITTDAEVKSAYFFSDDNSISPDAVQTLTKTEKGYSLTLPRNDNRNSMAREIYRFRDIKRD